jgi:lipopolysaccharide kinase (Kdo/WaaP) family protein
MATFSDYREVAVGGWRIFALSQSWNARFRDHVLGLVRVQATARHPQTIELAHEIDGEEKRFFLKVFHRTTLSAALKDQLRGSRAVGSWRQGLALAAAGFNAPLAIAVGVESGLRLSRREFIMTAHIAGAPLPAYLKCAGASVLTAKRDNIRSLARVIRRFHEIGFVHGDLVATNIFVVQRGKANLEFYFMDNDRTRRYPSWLRQSLWKRNLIQLNRMPLPGISLQDRICFLHAYLNVERLSGAQRRFARWLEAKTRERRKECDGADPTVSFRRLMRWAPEMAGRL